MVVDLLMDPGINVAFQQFSPALTSFFTQGEFLDSMPWYFLLISLVTFGLHPRHGVRLAMLFGLNSGLNETVKLACRLPRPYWVSAAVKAYSAHSSFGFPSGAAMTGMVVYGYIANVVRRYWAYVLCAALLIATSLVRIFSGIHFLLDIFGGWLLGLLLLAAFLLAAPRVEEYAMRLSRPALLVLIVLIAAIPLLLAVPAYLSLSGWQVPAAWAGLARLQTGAAINPVRIQFSYGASGIILGSLAGYEFFRSRGGWSPPEDRKRRAGVIIAGTASVLLVNAVLPVALFFLGITTALPPLATFLSMAGVSFWLMTCVPCIAKKAGYTKKQSKEV